MPEQEGKIGRQQPRHLFQIDAALSSSAVAKPVTDFNIFIRSGGKIQRSEAASGMEHKVDFCRSLERRGYYIVIAQLGCNDQTDQVQNSVLYSNDPHEMPSPPPTRPSSPTPPCECGGRCECSCDGDGLSSS